MSQIPNVLGAIFRLREARRNEFRFAADPFTAKTARRSASYGRNSLLRHHQDAPLPSVWLGSSRGFDNADLNRGKGAARRAAVSWRKSRMNRRFPLPRASAGEVLKTP